MSLILRQCESLDAGMLSVYERLAREWPKVVILKPRSLGISTLM